MSAKKLMLVLGATGFLGRQVIDRMLASNHALRVVTRGSGDWQDPTIKGLRKSGVEVIIGDVTDDGTLKKALDGVSAVVNMVGVWKESDDDSFQDLHVTFVERLLALSEEFPFQRLIHVSCLGARSDSGFNYFLTKWRGEQLVRNNSRLYWTIFRPSYMFGDRFPLLAQLRPFIAFKLFLPLIGSGTNSVQPVFVGDMADCLVQSIYDRETVNKAYDIVGPDKYSMLRLLETARKQLGLGGSTMNIPSKLSGFTFDVVAKALPNGLITNDLAGLMSEESCGSPDSMLENFDVKYVSLEEYLPKIVESMQRSKN